MLHIHRIAMAAVPGCCPLLAPALLVLLRILQGIAVGGEWGGAALLERTPVCV
jgi:MFS family permease